MSSNDRSGPGRGQQRDWRDDRRRGDEHRHDGDDWTTRGRSERDRDDRDAAPARERRNRYDDDDNAYSRRRDDDRAASARFGPSGAPHGHTAAIDVSPLRNRGETGADFNASARHAHLDAAVDAHMHRTWGDGPPVPAAAHGEVESALDAPHVAPTTAADREAERMKPSGALASDRRTGNVVNGVVVKWTEALDARVPTLAWRLFVFKDKAEVEAPLRINAQSSYLIGRDRRVADIPVDHPSCSGQHAVVTHRFVPLAQEAGDMAPPRRAVKPYIMDLGSTNGTFLNDVRLEDARYVELRPGDVIRFGTSTREYVLMHDEMVAKPAR